MPFLTIFTPVYNRAYCISQLYESLCRQTLGDFEWLVVDDGSTDNISEVMEYFIAEGKVDIRFVSQPNGGKHRAINRGVRMARGELFFIVDSDDYLSDDAVGWIADEYAKIKKDNSFAGLSGIRVAPNGTKIGGGHNFGIIDANVMDLRYKHGVRGDLAEMYKTKVLCQYPFPEYEGERFCPEALIWNRIALRYKVRCCYKEIYVCEYLADGLTAKIARLRRESPRASMTYYSEFFHSPVGLVLKIKAAINFWRFSLAPYDSVYRMRSPLSLLAWLPGYVIRIAEGLKNKRR